MNPDVGVIGCTACAGGLAGDDVVRCAACGAAYPTVSGMPVLFGDLRRYLAQRHSVGLQMMRRCGAASRDMVAAAMPADARCDSRGATERRWAAVYQSSDNTSLYRHILNMMPPAADLKILEHGCSVGVFSRLLKGEGAAVTGVDTSFPALDMAARQAPGIQYAAADSLSLRCGRFDVVISLNMLEVVEPRALLQSMASRAARYVVVADPYDYARGDRTVSEPMDGTAVRRLLNGMGFDMISGTASPSFVPWSLRISPRTTIRYLVDLVIGERK